MTSEYIAQMGPMLAIAGAFVAWLAQIRSTSGGYGFMPDMAIAVGGSVLAGAFVWVAISPDAGMLGMVGIGGIGALVAIVAQRGLWRSAAHRSVA